MTYYLGKGKEFKKEECKEYKTLKGALDAAAKDENLMVWDENGNVVGALTDKVPEGALDANPDGSVNAYDENGNAVGTISGEEVDGLTGNEATNGTEEPEKNENEQPQEDEVMIPKGKMKITVICDTALNLRRSPKWGNDNICGRAMRGQSYYVKAIHTVDGKKMVQTVDGIYLSGQSDHVQFEQL